MIFSLANIGELGKNADMKSALYVPNCLRSAGRELRLSFARPVEQLSHKQFLRAWCSIAYLFPGLHPDAFEEADSGWPRVLKRFAAEAWRRADAGELADDELYPRSAQWSGLYDRMYKHKPDEMYRRFALAADYGEPLSV